jgi:hypothetical protein
MSLNRATELICDKMFYNLGILLKTKYHIFGRGVFILRVSTKPLITEEIWPGRGLAPGLPNETQALDTQVSKITLHHLRYRRKRNLTYQVRV